MLAVSLEIAVAVALAAFTAYSLFSRTGRNRDEDAADALEFARERSRTRVATIRLNQRSPRVIERNLSRRLQHEREQRTAKDLDPIYRMEGCCDA